MTLETRAEATHQARARQYHQLAAGGTEIVGTFQQFNQSRRPQKFLPEPQTYVRA